MLNLSSLRHTNPQKGPDKDTGPLRKMTNFAHFTVFSNIADFDTNVTFSYHVLKHFLLRAFL